MINRIKSLFAKPKIQQVQKTFFEDVVETSLKKREEDEINSLRSSKNKIVRLCEFTKHDIVRYAKVGAMDYNEYIDEDILLDARIVNNWCDKEHAVVHLEGELRNCLGDGFSVEIKHTPLMSRDVVELRVSWGQVEEED